MVIPMVLKRVKEVRSGSGRYEILAMPSVGEPTEVVTSLKMN